MESRVVDAELRQWCSRVGTANFGRLRFATGKSLTKYGVKFFAGFIRQTGVPMFINKSDGEPAMKALKDAAAEAVEWVDSIQQESPMGDHQANGDMSTVRTLKA